MNDNIGTRCQRDPIELLKTLPRDLTDLMELREPVDTVLEALARPVAVTTMKFLSCECPFLATVARKDEIELIRAEPTTFIVWASCQFVSRSKNDVVPARVMSPWT